jgi:amidase
VLQEAVKLAQAEGAAAGELALGAQAEDCILTLLPNGVQFPIAEPDYNAKRPLDLSAFSAAIAALEPARIAELDALVQGASIPTLGALMAEGAFTTQELVTYYVERIQRYDVNKLNSVLELNPQALANAADLDTARAEGYLFGPLHGIPVLLKDNIAAAGMHTTAGAHALADWMPARDAFLVNQLTDAGALILGKANLSEWANYMDPCMPSGFSTLGGQTRNPHGAHEVYGSSSGSGAALAAGFAAATVGSETAGSIVQPARANGVVALRPSQGLISRDMVIPLAGALDTPGPMGNTVTDVALLLNAMAGADWADPKTADAESLADFDFTSALTLDAARALRVGVIRPTAAYAATLARGAALLEGYTQSTLSEEEKARLLDTYVRPLLGNLEDEAIAALTEAGIDFVEIDDSALPPGLDTVSAILPYAFRADVDAFLAALGEEAPVANLAAVVAHNNEDPANRAPYKNRYLDWSIANTLTPEQFETMRTGLQAIASQWMAEVMRANDFDVLVYGTSYATMAGAAGIPALTVPAGLDANGRPQGIILTGPYLSDADLLSVGFALESVLNGRVMPDLEATLQMLQAAGIE